MNRLVLIKLGGSLITDKTKPMTAREEVIKELAKEIAELQLNTPDTDLIVGTGAGSFGHFLVQTNAMSSSGSIVGKKQAVKKIHAAVKQLNQIFIDALASEGIKVTSLTADELSDKRKVAHAISEGVLSIYGDITSDRRSYTVVSTENSFIKLAKDFKKMYQEITVIFATSVPGVLGENGRVLKKLDNLSVGSANLKETRGFDVTGGMKHKLEASLELLKWATCVYVLDGRKVGNISLAVSGKSVGTIIK